MSKSTKAKKKVTKSKVKITTKVKKKVVPKPNTVKVPLKISKT